MTTLIIGNGEVGKALSAVLSQYNPVVIDKIYTTHDSFDIMHICFPYSESFVEDVENYAIKYKPELTVVHSTVPVGTCSKIPAIHSPIRGIHPNLIGGIEEFVKFIGGPRASEVADYFRKAGLRVMLFDRSETTEAMKLFDTEYYRSCIEFTHRVKKYCDDHGLNFHEVYTLANQTYNEGYSKLGHPEYTRPVLQPIMGPIGGHCVVPNSKLIDD